MIWAWLVVFASIIWAIVNIMDKYVVEKELKDPALCAVIFGLVSTIVFEIATFLHGIAYIPQQIAFISMITGFIYVFGVFLYYEALERGEVSRAVPVMHTTPVFVILFASIFLGERLKGIEYIGILLLVLGAIMISIKPRRESMIEKGKRSFKAFFRKIFGFIDIAFWITISATIIFSIRNVLLKYIINQISIFSIIFWMGLGSFICSLIILAFHHPRIFKKGRKGVEHLIFINAITALAFIMFSVAVSLGSVSVITALCSLQLFFVFLLAVLLSKFEPKIINEELRRSTIELKFFALVLILIGTLLVA